MKYMDLGGLEELNNSLSCVNLGDSRVFGRIECYSCKNTGEDYRLKNRLKRRFGIEEEELSSSVGNNPQNYKTFFLLIATLNALFPDYDFSDLPLSNIKPITFNSIVNTVNHTLFNIGNDVFAKKVSESIWSNINSAVEIDECLLFQYLPIEEEDNTLWSWYYFFYSKKMKRILFFSCRAVRYSTFIIC
jgi:hypothetical protein